MVSEQIDAFTVVATNKLEWTSHLPDRFIVFIVLTADCLTLVSRDIL